MDDVLRVKLAETEHEWQGVAQLIDFKYREEWGIVPEPAQCHVIAVMGEEVIGTVGIEFSTCGKLPLEEYLNIKDDIFSSILSEELVEFTRWSSKYPYAGQLAALGATTYALQQGKKYVIFCIKERSIQHLKDIGGKFSILSATLRQNVPGHLFKYYIKYYRKPPYPQVAMADIRILQNVFRKIVLELKSQDLEIEIDI